MDTFIHCQFWHKLISSLFAISGSYLIRKFSNLATSWQEVRKKYIKDSDKIILLPNLTTANIQMWQKISCLHMVYYAVSFWQLHFWKLCGNAMLPKVVHQKFPHLGNFLFLPILANWKFPILEIFDLLSSFHSWKLVVANFGIPYPLDQTPLSNKRRLRIVAALGACNTRLFIVAIHQIGCI